MDAEEARTIGWALWRVRDDRGKSLRVIAGLAGISKDTLNRIECGERSPTLSEVRALADALQVSVSETWTLRLSTRRNWPRAPERATPTGSASVRAMSAGSG
ncbi:MAG: helix-turn-helix domain-containing protein [Pseudonocardiaceae bacterium]